MKTFITCTRSDGSGKPRKEIELVLYGRGEIPLFTECTLLSVQCNHIPFLSRNSWLPPISLPTEQIKSSKKFNSDHLRPGCSVQNMCDVRLYFTHCFSLNLKTLSSLCWMQVTASSNQASIANFALQPWTYASSKTPPPMSSASGFSALSVIKNVSRSPAYLYGTQWNFLQQRWCLTKRDDNASDPGRHIPDLKYSYWHQLLPLYNGNGVRRDAHLSSNAKCSRVLQSQAGIINSFERWNQHRLNFMISEVSRACQARTTLLRHLML